MKSAFHTNNRYNLYNYEVEGFFRAENQSLHLSPTSQPSAFFTTGQKLFVPDQRLKTRTGGRSSAKQNGDPLRSEATKGGDK